MLFWCNNFQLKLRLSSYFNYFKFCLNLLHFDIIRGRFLRTSISWDGLFSHIQLIFVTITWSLIWSNLWLILLCWVLRQSAVVSLGSGCIQCFGYCNAELKRCRHDSIWKWTLYLITTWRSIQSRVCCISFLIISNKRWQVYSMLNYDKLIFIVSELREIEGKSRILCYKLVFRLRTWKVWSCIGYRYLQLKTVWLKTIRENNIVGLWSNLICFIWINYHFVLD